jgi:hypothetical protein
MRGWSEEGKAAKRRATSRAARARGFFGEDAPAPRRGRRAVDPLFRAVRADVVTARRTRGPRTDDRGWPGEELFG